MTMQQDHPAFDDESGLIRTSLQGNVLQVAGELDFDSSTQLFASASSASEPPQPITIDMGAVTFMDSTAIGVLVQVSHQRTVTIVNPSEQVRRILEITGLTEWFGLERDADGTSAQN